MGSLVATVSKWEPYRLLGSADQPVGAVASFFGDLLAAGRSEVTVRSYGMDLPRWFRFLWAVEVAWTARPGWRPAISADGCYYREFGSRVPVGTTPYFGFGAGAQRNGAAWLLRFPPRRRHRTHGQPVSAGPVAACGPRARASQPDGAVWQPEGRVVSATCGQTDPAQHPGCGVQRDPSCDCPRIEIGRWWRSTSPLGRELRSCWPCKPRGVDPGRQLITVVRKGSREAQELPASPDAFVWLRLYQVEMEGRSARTNQTVVVDATEAVSSIDLSRGAPHVRARERRRRHQRHVACAAAHGGLPDGSRSGDAAHRRAVGARARAADHHADLPDPAQRGRDRTRARPPR